MKMKKIAAYIALCALAMLCLCTAIEVKFTLASGEEPLVCTVPEGVFRKIGGRKNKLRYLLSCGLGQSSFAPEEERKSSLALSNISTREHYKHFTAFWETDLAVLSEKDNKLSKYQADLTQELFDRFLLTANFLEIQGKHAKRFAWNMVRYGLLGKHSKDITDLFQYQDKDVSHGIFWSLLRSFLNQIGFNYKITNPSAEQIMLRIEKADSWSRQIGEEYTAPAQGTSIRTVLCDMLGPLLSPRKERNEAVLSWLLLNIGGSSIDIEYSTKISSRDIFEFTQTIKQFTKENKKGSRVFVEGLNLVVDCRKDLYFPKAFHLVPDLSRLELYITPPCTPNRALLSLFRIVINSCKSLKALEITGLTLNSVEISMLAKSLPSIEKLSFSCNILEDIDIDSLNECVHLESLEIYGKLQLSATVQALVRHHPSLKRLSIMCDNLDPGVAKSFEVCTCLESLEILGVCQPNATVQELVKHLPFLKALTIKCQPLDSTTAKNFHLCNKIEKLILCGDIQPSAAIEELLKNLSFIKDLKIGIDVVSHNIVIALRKCCTLYSLDLIVENYTPNTLAQYLKSPLPKLKYLEVYNQNNNNNYTKEDNLAVEKACAMGMSIYLGILPH